MKERPIKKILDEIYGVTDEDVHKMVLEQKIEEEEDKIKILKELVRYKSFEDYVKDHEKDFEMVDVNDDRSAIIISDNMYQYINLDLLKKIGMIADHFGLLVHIVHQKDNYAITKKFDLFRRKENV